MRKIDLVMLSKLGLGDGGRETWLKNFLEQILKEGKEVSFNLITLTNDSSSLLDKCNAKLINYHHTYTHTHGKIPFSIGFIFFCFKNLFFEKKLADDVIAVGGLNEALATVGAYSFRNVKGKRVIWLRTIYTKEKGYALNYLTQKIVLKFEIFILKNFFDIVIANGEDTADFYRDLGVDCTVIKNSINLDKWNYLKPPDYSDVIDIAYVGRLSEVKGIKAFLEAIDYLEKNSQIEGFQFHIIGDGPYIDEVDKYSKRGLVKSYGAIPNSQIPAILEKVHCCVALTYLSDFLGGGGVSNALIEQMASEKTIICWDNNIFRSVLADDSGYFVEQGNIVALANSFLNIRSGRNLAKQKAKNAKRLSLEYSIRNHVNSFFESMGIE